MQTDESAEGVVSQAPSRAKRVATPKQLEVLEKARDTWRRMREERLAPPKPSILKTKKGAPPTSSSRRGTFQEGGGGGGGEKDAAKLREPIIPPTIETGPKLALPAPKPSPPLPAPLLPTSLPTDELAETYPRKPKPPRRIAPTPAFNPANFPPGWEIVFRPTKAGQGDATRGGDAPPPPPPPPPSPTPAAAALDVPAHAARPAFPIPKPQGFEHPAYISPMYRSPAGYPVSVGTKFDPSRFVKLL